MSLYKTLSQNKILFLFCALTGIYLGTAAIILVRFSEQFVNNNFSLNSLILQTVGSNGALFETILFLFVFATLGITIAYGFAESRAYEEIDSKLDMALEANKSRSELISMLLHHIRIPLTGIKWSLDEILKNQNLPQEHREVILKIKDENERGLKAVDRLISASQAKLDRISYNFEVISLADFLKIIKHKIDIFSAQAKNKNIKIFTDFCFPSDMFFKIDKDKIVAAIETILENAITYTPNNGIIQIAVTEGDKDLILSISDSGIGIPSQDHEKIFSQFFRAKESKSINPAGCGIGLYLAKKFIDRHNGRIWFFSQHNKGTMFSVSLPKLSALAKEGKA